ncbi:MAG: LysM peptidoglycan-binding domain-containing protein [Lachnospiraceae bacterium]|nr:LysM peptidoglycan-binding domain-containing protein [Lachnospiraceae bacterium]
MRMRTKKVLAWCCMALAFAFAGNFGVQAEEIPTDAENVQEMIDHVKAYYDAVSASDLQKANELRGEKNPADEILQEVLAAHEHGKQRYENVCVKVYPMEKEEDWLAFVTYELRVESIEDLMPGAEVYVLEKQADGSWWMITEPNQQTAEEAKQMIHELAIDEDILRIDEEYNQLYAENPDVAVWTKEIQQEIAERYTLVQEENNASEKYVVKKGDCLWSIAQEQMGDGIKWTILYQKNRTIIGENPDLILEGMQLSIENEISR